jgi:hypothetical protein
MRQISGSRGTAWRTLGLFDKAQNPRSINALRTDFSERAQKRLRRAAAEPISSNLSALLTEAASANL